MKRTCLIPDKVTADIHHLNPNLITCLSGKNAERKKILKIENGSCMSILKFFVGKNQKSDIRLKKSETGDWMVKKGFSILYIGSKEKCETFMKQAQGA